MIRADNLTFSYSGTKPFLLNEISFVIKDGEYVSVVGDNGSGKSTLIRLILGFLKPTFGNISSYANRIGYVPQKSDYLNSAFPITVYEMLNSYRKLLRVKDKELILKNLSIVGLQGYENHLMGSLSGGQHQKAIIARALMGSPDLLILDEPSTGVDIESQHEIYGLIKKLNVENGITIFSVEHNLAAAVSNSTVIYHLSGGKGHFCTPQKYASEYLKGKSDGNA